MGGGAKSATVVVPDVPPASPETCKIADGQRDGKVAQDDHGGSVALLPDALDHTAERIRDAIAHHVEAQVAVRGSDSHRQLALPRPV